MYGNVPPNNTKPENAVEDIIDPAKVPRNPFNGGNVFLSGPNEPSVAGQPIPGAIACATAVDGSTGGNFDYYALMFQGTDSTKADSDPSQSDFHAGMGDPGGTFTLAMVREGVFFTKVRQ